MKKKVKLNSEERTTILVLSGMFIVFGVLLIVDGLKEVELYVSYLHFALAFVIIPLASMYFWSGLTGKL